jgi:hypothetical protein
MNKLEVKAGLFPRETEIYWLHINAPSSTSM